MFLIIAHWQDKEPARLQVWDDETALGRRDARFTLESDAYECCRILDKLITASTFKGATVAKA